jgi:imidazolonepropionase-like amidohydrolase
MRAVSRLLVVFATIFLCVNLNAQTSQALAIVHVTVIDATGAPPKADQTVFLRAGRIVEVGDTSRVQFPKGVQTLDARGKFLVPGLWDMHVHLAGINADPAWSKNVLLPLLVANRILGVRDMGGDLETLLAWNRAIEAGTLLGPHIVASGPWLAGGGKKSPEQIPVSNEAEARAAVRDLNQRGADFIKIITLPSREAFFAVADEAKKQGLPFVGHVPSQVTASEASDAGMHSIEHIVYSALAFDCSGKEDELRQAARAARARHDAKALADIDLQAIDTYSPEKAGALWARFKKNGTWVVPTLASIAAIPPPKETLEEQSRNPQLDYIPRALREQWDPRSPDNQMPASAQAWWQKQYANDFKLAGEMHRAGVRMLAGSDSLDRFVFPGESLHKELQLLQEDGFSPMEALQSATRDAARFLGREYEFGTIRSGQLADLVLLDANPLENIANTSKIVGVIRGGEFLDRTALDKLLKQAKDAAQAVEGK